MLLLNNRKISFKEWMFAIRSPLPSTNRRWIGLAKRTFANPTEKQTRP